MVSEGVQTVVTAVRVMVVAGMVYVPGEGIVVAYGVGTRAALLLAMVAIGEEEVTTGVAVEVEAEVKAEVEIEVVETASVEYTEATEVTLATYGVGSGGKYN